MHSSKTYYKSIFNRYNNVKNSLKNTNTYSHISKTIMNGEINADLMIDD